MAADDPQGFLTWAFGLLGMTGAGGAALKLHTTQSDHSARIKALEGRQSKHGDKLDAVHDTVARLDERSERAETDRQEILRLLRERQ